MRCRTYVQTTRKLGALIDVGAVAEEGAAKTLPLSHVAPTLRATSDSRTPQLLWAAHHREDLMQIDVGRQKGGGVSLFEERYDMLSGYATEQLNV